MKFALFLIAALCATQGFEARSVKPDDTRAISDVIQAIINKIKEIISAIQQNLPGLIQQIKDKIQEVIGKLGSIINNIKDKIQELVQLGEAGKKCVEAHRDELEQLAQNAQAGIQKCVNDANASRDKLEKLAAELVQDASALRDAAIKAVGACVEECGLNPICAATCIKNKVEPEIDAFRKKVEATAAAAKDIVTQAANDLAQCAKAVHDDTAAKGEAIIDAIKKCIQESQQ